MEISMTNRNNTTVQALDRDTIDALQRNENARRRLATVCSGKGDHYLDAGVLRTIARG